MLQLSENDIKNGRILTQEQIDKIDLKWLEELQFGLKLLVDKEGKY